MMLELPFWLLLMLIIAGGILAYAVVGGLAHAVLQRILLVHAEKSNPDSTRRRQEARELAVIGGILWPVTMIVTIVFVPGVAAVKLAQTVSRFAGGKPDDD